MKKEEIYVMANGLLEIYGEHPLDILKDMEIDIEPVPQGDRRLFGNDSSIIPDINTIFIRNDLEDYIQNFKISHELGHLLMHTDENGIMFPNSLRREKEADYFAFCLANVSFDEIEMSNMTLDQIASCVKIPHKVMNQLANF